MTLVHLHQLILMTPSVSSVSHSTHMYTSCVTVVLLYTGIDDLFEVQMCVKHVVNWKNLGLALGLLYPTLEKLEKEQHHMVDDCVREMLVAWLQQQDNVTKNGAPSWTILKTALRKIGANQLADNIN